MIHLGCYETNQELITKSFCKIAEKSFESFNRTYVITANEDIANTTDRALWTYSKKHFIPHAKSTDPMPDQQPVLIGTDASIIQPNAESLILVNLDYQKILDTVSSIGKYQKIQKISIIWDDTANLSKQSLTDLFNKSNLLIDVIKFYKQLSVGKWSLIE